VQFIQRRLLVLLPFSCSIIFLNGFSEGTLYTFTDIGVRVLNVSLKCYTLPSLCILVSYFHCTSFQYCCFPLYSAVATFLPQRRYLRRTSQTNCRTCNHLHGDFVLNHSRFISCQKNSKFENLYRMSSWNETRSLKLQIRLLKLQIRSLKLQIRSRNSILTIFIINSSMLKQVSEMTLFISQTFCTPGEKIIESWLTYLLRNLTYCDRNDLFKFGKLMWSVFLHAFSSKLPTENCRTTSDQTNKQITKDDWLSGHQNCNVSLPQDYCLYGRLDYLSRITVLSNHLLIFKMVESFCPKPLSKFIVWGYDDSCSAEAHSTPNLMSRHNTKAP
jgi:hypothetical protein